MSNIAKDDILRPGIHLGSVAARINPFLVYKKLREQHPVCQIEPDGIWAISRYADVQFALKRHDLFSSSGFKKLLQPDWLRKDCRRGGFLLMEDPPSHTKHRALISKAFMPSTINRLIPLMKETAKSLVDGLKTKKKVEFISDFSYPYIGEIIGRVTGTEESQSLDEIHQWVEQLESIPPTTPNAEYITALEKILVKQNYYFRAIIKKRKNNPKQDLISKLVHAEVNGEKLTDDLLRQSLDLIIGAGFQTTVQMINHSIIRFARQPNLLLMMKQAPELISNFTEEILRYSPSGLCALRETTQDITLSNVTIPKKSLVFIMFASANHDPLKFKDPDSFKLNRSNAKQHFAFGHGIHTCVGATLARLEIKIALQAIINGFNSISCPADKELDWINSFMSRGVRKLPISLN